MTYQVTWQRRRPCDTCSQQQQAQHAARSGMTSAISFDAHIQMAFATDCMSDIYLSLHLPVPDECLITTSYASHDWQFATCMGSSSAIKSMFCGTEGLRSGTTDTVPCIDIDVRNALIPQAQQAAIARTHPGKACSEAKKGLLSGRAASPPAGAHT